MVEIKYMDAPDTLAFYGGEVKALGGGKLGGYLVLFSGPDDPDLAGDFFTKSTNFFIRDGDERPLLYYHGLDPVLKARQLGRARLGIDDVGIWIEGQLEERDKYEKAILKLAESGKLGWSSGSMSHLVTKKQLKKAFEVESWPIGEASLTIKPVEPRTSAFTLKSLPCEVDLDATVKSFEDQERKKPLVLEGLPALMKVVSPLDLKGMDERSEAVEAAAEEFFTHEQLFLDALRSHVARIENNAQFRFEKDGRPVSQTKRKGVVVIRERLAKMMADHKEIDSELAEIQKLFELTDSQQKAIDEQARAELWRTYRMSGHPLEELENGTSTS